MQPVCITPCRLPEGGEVSCRNCWQCRENRVNDLIGRCIAEQNSSDHTVAVTLTYRGDTPHAGTLVYKDIQDFFKRVRKAGFSVRYIVAGEYGSKKGRTHWHAILFFKGACPDVVFDKRIKWKLWPAGFSYFQRPDYKGFKYVLKYTLKDQDACVHVNHLAMSKKPPLGHDHFMETAQKYVNHSLSPQSAEYSFRDIFTPKGERRKFWLQGRMRELFLERYIELYKEIKGVDYPYSEFIELHEDKMIRRAYVLTDAEILLKMNDTFKPYSKPPPYAPETAPITDTQYILFKKDDVLLIRHSDGQTTIQTGSDSWLIKSAAQLESALKTLGLSTNALPKEPTPPVVSGIKSPTIPTPTASHEKRGIPAVRKTLSQRALETVASSDPRSSLKDKTPPPRPLRQLGQQTAARLKPPKPKIKTHA